MAKRTRKVGSTGRFQARYGLRARKRVKNIEDIQRAKHECPSCGHTKVKRISTSIWECKKCGTKFAGGAYIPSTEMGRHARRLLSRGGEIEEMPLAKEVSEGEEETE